MLLKRLRLKRKWISAGTVVSLSKKEHGSKVHCFVKLHKVFKINI